MKEKQIDKQAVEEMAEIILKTDDTCRVRTIATRLYNAGYRKQSERFLVKENGDIVPLTQQSEWISVDERLPDLEPTLIKWGDCGYKQKSIRVLCACKQRSGKTLVKEGYCEVWVDSQIPHWKIPGSIDEVTHWMPLPEPPKMKGGAE